MLENNRVTGRTTDIVNNCLRFASTGEYVLLVFPTLKMAKHILYGLESVFFKLDKSQMRLTFGSGSVNFISADQLYHNIIGRNDYRLFFDHTVSERDGVKIAR